MRRPVPVATGVVVLLLVLGSPFLRINPGLPSYQSLPESNDARRVAEALATDFDGNQSEQFAVVLPGTDPRVRTPTPWPPSPTRSGRSTVLPT